MLTPLRIEADFQELCPPLAAAELAQLEKNIVENGCIDPIVVWNGIVLDGHNRFAICTKLGRPYRTHEMAMADRTAAMNWIILHQLGRRNLTPEQQSDLRAKLYESEKESHGGARTASPQNDNLNTAASVGARTGVSEATVLRDVAFSKGLDRIATVDPETKRTILAGHSKATKQAVAKIAKLPDEDVAGAVAALKASAKGRRPRNGHAMPPAVVSSDAADRVTLFHGLMSDAPIARGSVDLIIVRASTETDRIGSLSAVGMFAADALKSGGSLLVLVEQGHMPAAVSHLARTLNYHWMLACVESGAPSSAADGSVKSRWTPMLWFTKGPSAAREIDDFVDGRRAAKRSEFPDWTVAELGMADIVERFTELGDLVCDPCAGDGTTVVVAAQLGRRVVGIDADAKRFKAIQSRVGRTVTAPLAAASADAAI